MNFDQSMIKNNPFSARANSVPFSPSHATHIGIKSRDNSPFSPTQMRTILSTPKVLFALPKLSAAPNIL